MIVLRPGRAPGAYTAVLHGHIVDVTRDPDTGVWSAVLPKRVHRPLATAASRSALGVVLAGVTAREIAAVEP